MGLLRVCLVGAGLVAAAGCNLTDTDPPSSAFYKLTSDKPVQLITSTEFAVGGTEVSLFRADTVTVSTKEATVNLTGQPRFFIRAIPTAGATTIQLKVDVGSKNWYDANRTVSPPDKLEFVYGYTGVAF
jgi:hypothetical protein